MHRIFPEWNVRAAFVSNELEWAMSADAKLSSHPIEVDCPDPRMISQVCYRYMHYHCHR